MTHLHANVVARVDAGIEAVVAVGETDLTSASVDDLDEHSVNGCEGRL
jgi:hypothetical protein